MQNAENIEKKPDPQGSAEGGAKQAPRSKPDSSSGAENKKSRGESDTGGAKSRSAKTTRRKTPPVANNAEAKAVIECLLFATTEPLSLRKLQELVHPLDAKTLRALLVELQNEYDSRGSGLKIVEVAGGFQIATRPRYADWVSVLYRRKRRSGLSPAMLETLAIVAYKQPIIRAEIDAIRGVDSSGVIHALQEMGLIEVVGQKQVPGRPFLYGTTKEFLKHFGLKSLSELPSLEALRERFESSER